MFSNCVPLSVIIEVAVPTDDVFPNEVCRICLGDLCRWLSFHPFGEIVDGDDGVFVLSWRSWELPMMSTPYLAKGRGTMILPNGVCDCLWMSEKCWHLSQSFTHTHASFFMVGQKYPCLSALSVGDTPTEWFTLMPLCISWRTLVDSTLSRHRSSDVE